MNLLKMVTGMMTDGMMGKIASLVGSNAGVTRTAMTTLLPSLLKGIAGKASTEGGASSLLNMIKDNALGGDLDLGDDLMSKGSALNESIFGSALKDISVPGMSGDAKSKLMNLATPMMLGSIGKVAQTQNLDAKGLSSYLQNQLTTGAKDAVGAATANVSRAASTTTAAATDAAGGGLGFLKWALPALALLGGLYWFMNKPAATPVVAPAPTAKPAPKVQHTHTHSDGTVHQGATHGSATSTTTTTTGGTTTTIQGATNAAGNAVKGAAGAAAGAAGDAVKGAAGNMGDAVKGAAGSMKGAAAGAGNVLDAAKDAAGNAVNNAAGAAGDAVKGAVNAAGDAVGGAAGDAIKGAAGAAGDAAAGAAGKAGEAIKGAAGDVKGAAGDAAKKIGGK